MVQKLGQFWWADICGVSLGWVCAQPAKQACFNQEFRKNHILQVWLHFLSKMLSIFICLYLQSKKTSNFMVQFVLSNNFGYGLSSRAVHYSVGCVVCGWSAACCLEFGYKTWPVLNLQCSVCRKQSTMFSLHWLKCSRLWSLVFFFFFGYFELIL